MLGERIKSARTAAGLSLRALAGEIGVSAMALSKYERGLIRPSPPVLVALTAALGVPDSYFEGEQALALERVEYRASSRLTPVSKNLIHAEIRRQLGLRREIAALVPELRPPRFRLPRLPAQIRGADEIEAVAEALRDAWGLSEQPIANLTNVLEARGVTVVQVTVRDGWFDGLACEVDGEPVVVVGADWPGDRQRFTLAHELGHLVLAGRLPPWLDEEQACHRFAGAFLAPHSVVARLVIGPEVAPLELFLLKHEWGLSMGAWIYRLRDAGRIDEKGFRVLWKDFRQRGWQREEPGPGVAREVGTVWRRNVCSLVANGRLSRSIGAQALNVEEAEIEALMEIGTPV